ncbi:hypothetical protein [Pedomonas mirosovicensis]|uniref:hypothetical protein n=1 Tax=Pedomonas mirosovicensis TaxID=2908641 RepID=UPI0021694731|nr:hypothetical protein [Pedomonas mirosovicensis]MCH8685028.1 hypothetical protein [Pedomonas mirosovicensis]
MIITHIHSFSEAVWKFSRSGRLPFGLPNHETTRRGLVMPAFPMRRLIAMMTAGAYWE